MHLIALRHLFREQKLNFLGTQTKQPYLRLTNNSYHNLKQFLVKAEGMQKGLVWLIP